MAPYGEVRLWSTSDYRQAAAWTKNVPVLSAEFSPDSRFILIVSEQTDAELFEVGAALLERARSAGTVVVDADATDVLKLIGAIARAVQDAPDGVAQFGLVLNGLRRRVT